MSSHESTATERFVFALEDVFNERLSDVDRSRLEDAFNDAVDARVEKALAEDRERREREY